MESSQDPQSLFVTTRNTSQTRAPSRPGPFGLLSSHTHTCVRAHDVGFLPVVSMTTELILKSSGLLLILAGQIQSFA